MTDEILQRIEKLAASCECSASDIGYLLKSMASQLEADNATGAFLKADDALRTALTEAYMTHVGRNAERLIVNLLTKPQLREDLSSWLFDELKADAEHKQVAA